MGGRRTRGRRETEEAGECELDESREEEEGVMGERHVPLTRGSRRRREEALKGGEADEV